MKNNLKLSWHLFVESLNTNDVITSLWFKKYQIYSESSQFQSKSDKKAKYTNNTMK